MDNAYKITPGLEKEIANRNVKFEVALLIIWVPLLLIFLNPHPQFFRLLIGSCCGYIVMVPFIYLHRRINIRWLKEVVYKVSDDSLSVTSINRSLWGLTKKHQITFVLWEDIKSITYRNHSLVVKRKKGLFSNIGAVHLPMEIENFDELEKIIRAKTAEYGLVIN